MNFRSTGSSSISTLFVHQVDLLSPAADKITQQEYHAQRRGQLNLDIANMELLGDGITPMHTTFETNKEKFRNAISDIAERATSFEEFLYSILTFLSLMLHLFPYG